MPDCPVFNLHCPTQNWIHYFSTTWRQMQVKRFQRWVMGRKVEKVLLRVRRCVYAPHCPWHPNNSYYVLSVCVLFCFFVSVLSLSRPPSRVHDHKVNSFSTKNKIISAVFLRTYWEIASPKIMLVLKPASETDASTTQCLIIPNWCLHIKIIGNFFGEFYFLVIRLYTAIENVTFQIGWSKQSF